MARTPRTPAQGEQAAISGYQKQYEYSACEIYRLMQEGTFRGVTIAEREAGIFDDLVLHFDDEVRATQVKTQGDVQSVALNTALVGNTLIKSVAASWTKLRLRFPHQRIKLRYIFGGYFSTGDEALANGAAESPKHSAEFARFVRRDDHTAETLKASPWSAKLAEMQTACELKDDEFAAFISGLELHDHQELARNRIEHFPAAERTRVEAIQSLLPRLVARREIKAHLSEADLVRELGWHKISQRNVHEFPIPDDFQDNEQTRAELLEALANNTRGYLSVVGPPGTGKSTLLQTVLFSTPDYSISRYLAFMPDQRHGLGRAEGGAFLNDIIAELMGLGLGGSTLALDNLADQHAELARQLENANKRYADTGRRTVIVIDGLDHVPREERTDSSFLKQLPAAQSIPDGVIIVLGTQTLELADLHASVIQQANATGRLVQISPLPRAAIFAMADKAKLPALVDRERLFEVSSGHPLTARYFVEALKQARTPEDVQRILSDTEGLGRSLDDIYGRVWSGLAADAEAKNALGLLARAEVGLTPEQMASVYGANAVESVIRSAAFLLSGVGEERLAIFHNSFRLFIADQTRIRFGKSDLAVDVEFNQLLSDIAARARAEDPQRWMELRYRARAGDHAGVLRIGTAEHFRASLAAFRPSSEIYTDLRLTYAAVKPTRDRVTLLNKLLIEKEVEYRLEAVSDLDMVGLFIDLGEHDLAVHHALERRDGGDWQRLVDLLWRDGRHALARRVLEANEPLELLFGSDPVRGGNDISKARDWIERAQRFRPIERLTAIVAAIPFNADSDDVESQRQSLLYRIARGSVGDNPNTDVNALSDTLKLSEGYRLGLRLIAAQDALDDSERDRALGHLKVIDDHPDLSVLGAEGRIFGARLAYRAGEIALSRKLFRGLSLPALSERGLYRDTIKDSIEFTFEVTVLGALLDEAVNHGERRAEAAFINRLDDKVQELARLRAAAERGARGDDPLRLKGLIQYFAHAKPDRGDISSYKFYDALSWLATAIVDTGQKMGDEHLADVVTLIDKLIDAGDNNLSGSESFRLAWASALYRVDGDGKRATSRVAKTEAMGRSDRTPQEVVSFRASFAKAYGEVGEFERARTALNAMHGDTFGYWLRAKKEPQYEFWTWSYLRACEVDPGRSGERALAFARFILGMDETEGDDTARRVVGDLIAGAAFAPAVLAAVVARLSESSLTSWAQMTDSVLAAIAQQRPDLANTALIAFSRLVAPFLTSDCNRCIPACFVALESGTAPAAAAPLLNAILTWCPPSERKAALDLIVKNAPELADTLARDVERAMEIYNSLHRASSDGPGEVERARSDELGACTLAELVDAGDGKTDYGNGVDYRYARNAERLARRSSKQNIDAFVSARPHIERDAKFLIACVRSMVDLGDVVTARVFLRKAEKAASSGYWSSFLGGQKLELQKLRVELEGEAGVERGFDILMDELAGGDTYGSSLFLNLDDVLEQVTTVPHYEAWWAETQAHLAQYREYKLAEPLAARENFTAHEDVLAWVIAEAFNLNCPEVLDHARSAIDAIARAPAGGAILEKVLAHLHAHAGGPREAAALAYKLRDHAELRPILEAEARRCAEDEDFVVANLGARIMHYFGAHLDGGEAAPLPAFYALAPSGSPEADNFDIAPRLPPGVRPIWAEDPWTLTAMMQFAFEVLNDNCSQPLETLRRRCADFMRREGGREAFGPEREEALQAKLRRLDLKLSWRRLMPMAAQRGFGKVLNELAKAGAVNGRIFPFLWEEIGGPSLRGFDLREEARPDWMVYPAPPSRQYGGLDAELWLGGLEADAIVPLAADWFVLAERSFVKIRLWRENADTTRLCLPDWIDIESAHARLHGLPQLFSLDRMKPQYSEKDTKLVCQIFQPFFGDLREPAMTICPYVARKLGWVRSNKKPFELHDANGEPMAKTLRWVDGTDQVDTYESELYGEGQAVLLTRGARIQLEAAFGPVAINVKAIRRVNREIGEAPTRSIVCPPKVDPPQIKGAKATAW